MVNEPDRRLVVWRILLWLSALAAGFAASDAAFAQNPPDSGGKQQTEARAASGRDEIPGDVKA